MTTQETLVELVEQSSLNILQKNMAKGFIDRSFSDLEKHRADLLLIESISNAKNVSEVVLSTDEVKIYTVYGKDKWDVKYPYRLIFLNKEGKWRPTYTVSPSLDVAYLDYLQNKYIGNNSQFMSFAMLMLEMPPIE